MKRLVLLLLLIATPVWAQTATPTLTPTWTPVRTRTFTSTITPTRTKTATSVNTTTPTRTRTPYGAGSGSSDCRQFSDRLMLGRFVTATPTDIPTTATPVP